MLLVLVCLFVCGSLLLFRNFLIDVEDTRDVELHAVEVVSNHCPQLVETRVTGFCDLRGAGKGTSQKTELDDFFFGFHLLTHLRMVIKVTLSHLDDLPRHVQDATCCSAEEAPQTGDGAISDHSAPYRLSFTIQHPPPLLSLLPLPQLQLPLLLMVTQPHQTLLL